MNKRLMFCLVAALIVSRAQAGVVVVDTFSDPVLAPAWVKTSVLKSSSSPGETVFETTSVSGALSISNPTQSGAREFNQQTLLRSDFSLGDGETLYAKSLPFATLNDTVGIAVASTNSPAGRNFLGVSFFDRQNFLFLYSFDGTGALTQSFGIAILGSAQGLFIAKNSGSSFDVGYLDGADMPITVRTLSTAEPGIGQAVGFFADIRGPHQVSFSEMGILTSAQAVPEPGTAFCFLPAGLLLFSRRRRND